MEENNLHVQAYFSFIMFITIDGCKLRNNLGAENNNQIIIFVMIYSFSLSAFPFNLWGCIFTFVVVFLLHLFFIIFGVGLPAYLSNHNPFSREHIFVGFNKFPSLVYWCTVIHHHWPQGPTLFRRVRWDFMCVQCDVCTDTGPPVLSPIWED